MESSNPQFYDESYYQSHYGNLTDPTYHAALGVYWRKLLFEDNGLDVNGQVLDYGCGLGQVSAGLANSSLYDPSPYARQFLNKNGRRVFDREEDIPQHAFDYLLSSHSLEHSSRPADDLVRFRNYVKPTGRLVLVLPIEMVLGPALAPDSNQHFQTWTFQTITNMLLHCGWKPIKQLNVDSPWGLASLLKRMNRENAVKWAISLGKLKRQYHSMLTIASMDSAH
jgi:SAM-dependent methyltransferase